MTEEDELRFKDLLYTVKSSPDSLDHLNPADAARLQWAARFIQQLLRETSPWISLEQEKPEDTQRVLAYSPAYKEWDPMRYRLMEGQFLSVSREVTHWMSIPFPPLPERRETFRDKIKRRIKGQ
jgi:hypothetical protein